jgi:hypothetical protein
MAARNQKNNAPPLPLTDMERLRSRALWWTAILFVIISTVYACTAHIAHAQAGVVSDTLQDEATHGNAVHIDQQTADWFARLTRPFTDGDAKAGVASCCDAGDGYPIQIDEDAYPPGGKVLNGTAHITDPSAKQIVLPNGMIKSRPAITDPDSMTFHFAGERVSPLKDGNPTRTAWAFLHITNGKQDYIYCIVPLPPGY